jgi:hypothetical protein
LRDAVRSAGGAEVREGVAERLPWADGEFDAALSSLLLGFIERRTAGTAEGDIINRSRFAVAPAGQYLRSLSGEQRADVPRHRPDRGGCRAQAGGGPAQLRATHAAAIYSAGLELVRVGIQCAGSAAGMSGYSGTALSARVSAGRPATSGPVSLMASSTRTDEAIWKSAALS